jgi:hypothetical protein
VHRFQFRFRPGYVRSKLKQAITSANIYYSSRKWGQYRTLEKAKARLIADIAKAMTGTLPSAATTSP